MAQLSAPEIKKSKMNSAPSKALNHQAIAALKQGQAHTAISLLRPTCNETCSDPQSWFILGSAYGLASEPAAAEEAFRQCIQLNPGHLQARTNLGKILVSESRFNEAVSVLEEVLSTKPGHRPAAIALANALTQQKRYADAESYCRSFISGNESDAEIFTLLGNINRLKGEPELALELLKQATARNPVFVPAYVNSGL